MTQRAISWPLLVVRLIEKGGYVWSLGMEGPCGRGGDFLIGSGHVGETSTYVCFCAFACTHVHVCMRLGLCAG